VGLSPFLRSEILLIKFRVFEFAVLIDLVWGRSSKSVSSRARYPHFLLSDQRSAIIRPRKSRNPEKPILDFACCTCMYMMYSSVTALTGRSDFQRSFGTEHQCISTQLHRLRGTRKHLNNPRGVVLQAWTCILVSLLRAATVDDSWLSFPGPQTSREEGYASPWNPT